MNEANGTEHFLDGRFLIAMPGVGDSRFERAVIFVCAHSDEGAMGIVINRQATDVEFSSLLIDLDVLPKEGTDCAGTDINNMLVHQGGPVETGRGFVLHSPDFYVENATLPVDESVCLTATLDVLRAIAAGRGPDQALLALGYAGWAPGQLESEIQANGWLVCEADAAILFDDEVATKYDRALAKLGVAAAGFLSGVAGHA